ncbi:hypothetical protein ACFLRP_05215 [Bacteroidota bacterium]
MWLVGATFAVSFLIPSLITAVTGTLLSSDGRGYLQDFTATFSIGVGLPILVLFFTHYCERIPQVLSDIDSERTIKIGKKKYKDILVRFEKVYNSKWSITLLIPAAGLQLLWIIPLLNDYTLTWWSSYVSSSGNESISAAGLYFVFLAILYLYLVLHSILYFALTALLLRTIAKEAKEVKVRPLHPDDCGGLSKIGSIGLLSSYLIFLIGIGIVGVIHSDMYVHGHLPFSLPLHSILITLYLVFAPLLFFLPLYSFRAPMKLAKNQSLAYFSQMFETEYRRLPKKLDVNDKDEVHKILTELATISTSYDLAKKMPVWPFNLKLIERFSAIVIAPLLLIALPMILEKYIFKISI